ncbi:recombinase family protein, partial [Escherichia coli]|nr:recombinase family protein [Escherichia coli]
MSRIFAYCRISTLDQTTENQRREIESAGFKIKPQQIIEEHISGSALMNPLMILVKIIKLRWIH